MTSSKLQRNALSVARSSVATGNYGLGGRSARWLVLCASLIGILLQGPNQRSQFLASTSLVLADELASTAGLDLRLEAVQPLIDRHVDEILAPLWYIAQPAASLFNYLVLAPFRAHLRIGGVATKSAELDFAVRRACNDACAAIRQLFHGNLERELECPDVVVVTGLERRLVVFPLGFGRRRLIVVTAQLVRDLSEDELRFALGREVGRLALHHSTRWPWWAVEHLALDATALPRWIVSRTAAALSASGRAEPEPPSQHLSTRLGAGPMRQSLSRALDGIRGVCQILEDLKSGQWKGIDGIISAPKADARPAGFAGMDPLDMALAICQKIQGTGAVGLGLSAVVALTPWAVTRAFDLRTRSETDIRRGLVVATWALRAALAKMRLEELSADRIGLLAARGRTDAAVRSIMLSAPRSDAAAMAAMLGTDEIVRNARVLDRVLSRGQLLPEASVPLRISELMNWARSPEGAPLVNLASRQ